MKRLDRLDEEHRRQFSAAVWLKLIAWSLLAAVASAAVLYASLTSKKEVAGPQIEVPLLVQKWPLLLEQTAGTSDDLADSIAPVGILDRSAKFAPLDHFEDIPPRPPANDPPQVAPLRLLDPIWHPANTTFRFHGR